MDIQLPPNLTSQQREAILHYGSPLLIIAGPGSGKTEVIAWRVAHLVQSGIVAPENVMAVTFTERAALSLKDRIHQKLPDVNVELMQVSTIHSFCAELLRRYAAHTALPHGYRILDETGQFLFVYSNRKALGLDRIIKGRPKDFFDAVLRTFNLAIEELVNPSCLQAWCQQHKTTCDTNETDLWEEREVVAEAYGHYCALLMEQNLVDFGFLQRHAMDLLKGHLPILNDLQAKYQEILVDEYQDTNAVQEHIIQLLAGDGQHLTVVGDDDQSIYRFRGATVYNILSFAERYPNAHIVKLIHNFRSRDPIVGHSLRVIVNNPARFPKDLHTVRGPGSDVLLVYEHTAAEEAASVARLISHLHQTGRIISYDDVVILLRSVKKSYSGPYLDALDALGIPCQVIGDASLFNRDEISQLYDLFNFLGTAKEWGDKYFRHALIGLKEATCQALYHYKGNLLNSTTVDDLNTIGVHDPSDCRRLLQFLQLKRRVLAQEHTSALQVFYELLAAADCVKRFELEGNAEGLSNLGIFSRLVAAWDEHGSTNNFYPFREYLKLLKEGGVDPIVLPTKDTIQIMTIHQAKGLEFPVVVLGAAMDGRLPSSRRKDLYEIPYEMRASGVPEVADPHFVDERKLFYVAATRARDLLIIGTADVVNKRGGGPSPFLYEMFGPDLKSEADISKARIAEIESRPPSGQDQRPRHSFSQLAHYLHCPIRYKFAVIYGLEVQWLDPVDFGANVHRCLEAIHRRALQGIPTEEDDIPALIEETWLSMPRSKPDQEEAYKKAAVNQLRRYIQKYKLMLDQVVQAETIFSFSLDGHVIQAKVDLIRHNGERELEVVDFKTSGASPEEVDQAEIQLSLYALGLETVLKKPVTHQIAHFLGDGQVYTWDWTEERKVKTKDRLIDILQCIENQEFPPRLQYCPQCQEFKAICPYPRN